MSLIIREMQIRATMRFLTPIRMTTIKNKNNKQKVRMWINWNPCARLVGMQNISATTENRMVVLKKLYIELPYDLAIPLLGLQPKELKAGIQTDTWTRCSQHHYSQYSKGGKNPNVYPPMNG